MPGVKSGTQEGSRLGSVPSVITNYGNDEDGLGKNFGIDTFYDSVRIFTGGTDPGEYVVGDVIDPQNEPGGTFTARIEYEWNENKWQQYLQSEDFRKIDDNWDERFKPSDETDRVSLKTLKEGNYHPTIGVSYDERVCLMPHQDIFDGMFVDSPSGVSTDKLTHNPLATAEYDNDFRDSKKFHHNRGGPNDSIHYTNTAPITSYQSEINGETKSIFSQTDRHSIGYIYFNINHLLDVYENMRLKKTTIQGTTTTTLNRDFNVFDYLETIWNDVNDATGGYYNFKLHTEHERPNMVRVVDFRVSGEPQEEKLFTFNPQGIRSITRQFYIDSKIDNQIAATISIAAQAPSNAQSLDSLSFKAFSKNIKSRFNSSPS